MRTCRHCGAPCPRQRTITCSRRCWRAVAALHQRERLREPDPDARTIRERCRAIQDEWSAETEAKRRVGQPPELVARVVRVVSCT